MENLIDCVILKSLPFGMDPISDIKSILENYKIETIIDVGANTGQSALRLIKQLPDAVIHCIEPSFETFQILINTLSNNRNVFSYQIALGEKNGAHELFYGGNDSSMYTLVNSNIDKQLDRGEANKIKIQMLDTFCDKNDIKHVNFLKIDTEGYDLNVLKGAGSLYSKNAIDFIEVEAGMNPRNKFHVPFIDLKLFLEGKGYLLFGFYDQTHEWIEKKPFLRRCNAVFISETLADNQRDLA
jgi:FkbM family methyltransferase